MDISDVHVSFGVLSFAYILELLLGQLQHLFSQLTPIDDRSQV